MLEVSVLHLARGLGAVGGGKLLGRERVRVGKLAVAVADGLQKLHRARAVREHVEGLQMHAAAVIQHTEQKAACLHGVDIAAGGVLLGQDLGCGAVGFQIVPEQAVPQADVERGKIGERLLQRLLEQRRVHSLAHHGCQAEYVGIAPARHHGKDIRGVVQLVPPRGCSAFFHGKDRLL